MARATDDSEYIRELFAGFGPVVVKRMFGGAGIYADGRMFAIAADGVIYLKTDEQTVLAFKREGLAPFTYNAKKKRVAMSYWRMPDRLYDDPEELAEWARKRWLRRCARRRAKNTAGLRTRAKRVSACA